MRHTEAAVRRCSVKKVFLEISQNSQENTCARVSIFNKVASSRPVNFAKFLRTPFIIEHFWWLLLNYRTLLVAASELVKELYGKQETEEIIKSLPVPLQAEVNQRYITPAFRNNFLNEIEYSSMVILI